MTPVWFLYIAGTWVTPSLLRIQISAEILLWKSENFYYFICTLLYTRVMQYKIFNQTKQNLSQISTFTKLLKVLSFIKCWRLLTMKDKFTYL